MRERWALRLALLTGAIVLMLSALFAHVQNTSVSPRHASTPATLPSTPATPQQADDYARGRAVFEAQGCRRCHAIAGQGNPRSPLDRVGGKYSQEQLHDWIQGTGEAADQLPRRALTAKQAYAALSTEELNALIAYLGSLQ